MSTNESEPYRMNPTQVQEFATTFEDSKKRRKTLASSTGPVTWLASSTSAGTTKHGSGHGSAYLAVQCWKVCKWDFLSGTVLGALSFAPLTAWTRSTKALPTWDDSPSSASCCLICGRVFEMHHYVALSCTVCGILLSETRKQIWNLQIYMDVSLKRALLRKPCQVSALWERKPHERTWSKQPARKKEKRRSQVGFEYPREVLANCETEKSSAAWNYSKTFKAKFRPVQCFGPETILSLKNLGGLYILQKLLPIGEEFLAVLFGFSFGLPRSMVQHWGSTCGTIYNI